MDPWKGLLLSVNGRLDAGMAVAVAVVLAAEVAVGRDQIRVQEKDLLRAAIPRWTKSEEVCLINGCFPDSF